MEPLLCSTIHTVDGVWQMSSDAVSGCSSICIYVIYINHSCEVYITYNNTTLDLGHRKFELIMDRAAGKGHYQCKFPMTEVEGGIEVE